MTTRHPERPPRHPERPPRHPEFISGSVRSCHPELVSGSYNPTGQGLSALVTLNDRPVTLNLFQGLFTLITLNDRPVTLNLFQGLITLPGRVLQFYTIHILIVNLKDAETSSA